MSSECQPNAQDADDLEAAVDQAITACGGDLRATVRVLIVANGYLESEAEELKKAVSPAFMRGDFGRTQDDQLIDFGSIHPV